MASVKLSLSAKSRQDTNEHEIFLRLSVDRNHVFRAKTGLYINKGSWSQSTQRVIIPRMRTKSSTDLLELQKMLDTLVNDVICGAVTTSLNEITKMWLIRLICKSTGITTSDAVTLDVDKTCSNAFLDVLNHFIDVQCKSKRRADHFHCMERMIKRFAIYSGMTLSLDDFTADQMRQFEKFLKIEHTFFDEKGNCIKHRNVYEQEPCKVIPQVRGINAINEIMRRFRTFFKWSLKNRYTTNNPFDTYQIPACVYGTPFYLTSEERDALFEYDFSDRPELAVQRDIFVFQSNVGMRAGDMLELTRANIVDDGVEYVANKTSDKTGTTIRVPLSSQARIILNRYWSDDRVELLPFIAMQPYNRAIKEMLRLAKIDRIVTVLNPTTREEEQHPIWEVASSHMARRNFIGNLYNKVPDPNIIGSMTGHVDGSKAFQRYRAIDENVKRSLVDLL